MADVKAMEKSLLRHPKKATLATNYLNAGDVVAPPTKDTHGSEYENIYNIGTSTTDEGRRFSMSSKAQKRRDTEPKIEAKNASVSEEQQSETPPHKSPSPLSSISIARPASLKSKELGMDSLSKTAIHTKTTEPLVASKALIVEQPTPSASDADKTPFKAVKFASKANELPSKANELLSKANELLSKANELPSKANELPSKANELPSKANELPSTALKLPSKARLPPLKGSKPPPKVVKKSSLVISDDAVEISDTSRASASEFDSKQTSPMYKSFKELIRDHRQLSARQESNQTTNLKTEIITFAQGDSYYFTLTFDPIPDESQQVYSKKNLEEHFPKQAKEDFQDEKLLYHTQKVNEALKNLMEDMPSHHLIQQQSRQRKNFNSSQLEYMKYTQKGTYCCRVKFDTL